MTRTLAAAAACALAAAQSPDDAVIRSGTPWYTADGQRMYAGGGNLYQEGGVFYLVGEVRAHAKRERALASSSVCATAPPPSPAHTPRAGQQDAAGGQGRRLLRVLQPVLVQGPVVLGVRGLRRQERGPARRHADARVPERDGVPVLPHGAPEGVQVPRRGDGSVPAVVPLRCVAGAWARGAGVGAQAAVVGAPQGWRCLTAAHPPPPRTLPGPPQTRTASA